MKRFRGEPGDDRTEERADPGERASGVALTAPRSSGTWEREPHRVPDRSRAPVAPVAILGSPAAEAPCRTFAELYARHGGEVWKVILQMGVDESDVNDVFQKIFAGVFTWTRARGLPPEAPLLFSMTQRQVISHLREVNRRLQRFDGEAETETMPSSKPDPEQQLGRLQARAEVDAILARMRPGAAAVFRIFEIDGLTPEEAVERLHRPAATLRVQLHRARAAFWALAERLYNVTPGDFQ